MHLAKKERPARAWVKNAAIVFLAVMLVLTFFSKTIMNISLTEISGQYMQAGSISTAVTGSGTVTAGQTVHVQLSETRTVQEVLVSAGDTVTQGQTLFILEVGENTALADAEQTLSDLQYAYNVLLVQNVDASYAAENQNIQNLRDQLSAAISQQSQATQLAQVYNEAKAAQEAAQSTVSALTITVADLEGQLALAAAGDETLTALNTQLATAQVEQTAAQEALTACQAETAAAQAGMTMTLSDADAALTAAKQSLAAAELELSYFQADYEALAADESAAPESVTEALRACERQALAVEAEKTAVAAAQAQYDAAAEADTALTAAKAAESAAQTALEEKTAAVTAAQAAVDARTAALSADLTLALTQAQADLTSAQARLSQAQAELSAAASDYTTTAEAASANVRSIQQSLESALAALSEQQLADGVAAQTADLALENAREAMEAQEAIVETLRQEGMITEVTAPCDGTVTEVNAVAGDIVASGQTMASISAAGQAYTMTVTVTAEQGQRLTVGELAEVTTFVYGEVEATLTAIRDDPEAPGKNKLLEFAVSGDVAEGQTLSISIGARAESYDTVVPKSAIHEDANGTFVYVARAKTTPLGTRYTVSRLAVIVEATDSFSAAITADAGESDYVVTAFGAPLTDGEQVRLAEQS